MRPLFRRLLVAKHGPTAVLFAVTAMGRSQFYPARHFLDIPLANGNGYISPLPPAISPLRLTPREDTTRVQLQRQRVKDNYATAIVSRNIPGLKTSATFFASLRTNLRLHASPPASPASTPPSMRGSATSLPPPSPLSQAIDYTMDNSDGATAQDPLAGVPELKTFVTHNEEEKIAALKLVADSVAQMRQTSNNSLITNPINMAVAVAVMALVARFIFDTRHDVALAGTTAGGILMGILALCRYVTQGYLDEAEKINFAWLGDADVLITKFGDEVVGTVIIEWLSGESRQKRKKAWRVEIKAWTVRLRYRRKGVGGALLEEAVKEAKKKGAENIEFADDHANALRVVPNFYNGVFDKREQKGREILQDLLESSPGRGKRK